MQNNKSEVCKTILAQLKNPFPKNLLKYRIGATTKDKTKAIPLFYLTARDVEKRLDDVLGLENWTKTTELITASNGLVAARTSIGIRLPDSNTWLFRDGIGEPSQIAGPLGAESQSFKRAAANWGIGRYLYYLDAGWQEINEKKQFKSDPRNSIPSWALPDANIKDWEQVAEEEYNSSGEIDIENLPSEVFSNEEKELLKKSEEVRKKLLNFKQES